MHLRRRAGAKTWKSCYGPTTWCTTTRRRRRLKWCTRHFAAPRSSIRCASQAGERCWRWCRATTTMRSASTSASGSTSITWWLFSPSPDLSLLILQAVHHDQRVEGKRAAAQRRRNRHGAHGIAERLERLAIQDLVARAAAHADLGATIGADGDVEHHIADPLVVHRDRRILGLVVLGRS